MALRGTSPGVRWSLFIEKEDERSSEVKPNRRPSSVLTN